MPEEGNLPARALIGDLQVGRIGFGGMALTGRGVWGDPGDRRGALAVLRRAVALGVNLIDTADAYGPETNERLIAEALHPYEPGVVLTTKGGYRRLGPGKWTPDGRPESLRRACEASLLRLRRDTHDLYQLHTVDSSVPLAESVGELARLRDGGKIRHVGLSNVSVDQLELARTIVPIASVQNRFNLLDRGSEPLLRRCEEEGIAFISWFPLAKGALGVGHGALREIARSHAATPAQVALAWLLAQSRVMVAIPGTRSVSHLEENVAAGGLRLTQDELRRLDEPISRLYKVRATARGVVRRVGSRLPARGARG